jgi:hypothetical protein
MVEPEAHLAADDDQVTLHEAVAQIKRFCHMGQFFTEPSDYYDAPIDKVLHFIRGVGLIKG